MTHSGFKPASWGSSADISSIDIVQTIGAKTSGVGNQQLVGLAGGAIG